MKKPWLAALLSFLLPGLGYIYIKEMKKGLIIIASVIFLSFLATQSSYVGILVAIIYIYSIVNSFTSTKSFRNLQA